MLKSPEFIAVPAQQPRRILCSVSLSREQPAHVPSEAKLVVSTNFKQPPDPPPPPPVIDTLAIPVILPSESTVICGD